MEKHDLWKFSKNAVDGKTHKKICQQTQTHIRPIPTVHTQHLIYSIHVQTE